MSLLRRKPKVRMNVQPPGRVECLGHLSYMRRKYLCCLGGKAPTPCEGPIETHHVNENRASEGGMGMKVGDHRVAPVCHGHHVPYIHRVGEAQVKKETGVDLSKVADEGWMTDDYHRLKFEREWRAEWPGVPLPYAGEEAELAPPSYRHEAVKPDSSNT